MEADPGGTHCRHLRRRWRSDRCAGSGPGDRAVAAPAALVLGTARAGIVDHPRAGDPGRPVPGAGPNDRRGRRGQLPAGHRCPQPRRAPRVPARPGPGVHRRHRYDAWRRHRLRRRLRPRPRPRDPRRRGPARAGGAGPADGGRAVQQLDRLRRAHHPEALPPGAAGPQSRGRGHRGPGQARLHQRGRAAGHPAHRRLRRRHPAALPRRCGRRLGAGPDVSARPVRDERHVVDPGHLPRQSAASAGSRPRPAETSRARRPGWAR